MAGRKCAHPECITNLSLYNPGPYCYQHTQGVAFDAGDMRDLHAAQLCSCVGIPFFYSESLYQGWRFEEPFLAV